MMPRNKWVLYSSGAGWQLANILEEAGDEAVVYFRKQEDRHLAEGLVKKIDDDGLREILRTDRYREWIFVWDDIGDGKIADSLRQMGWRVFGGGRFADKIEKDRGFARQVAERCGIKPPPTQECPNPAAAMQFIREHPGRYVLKPYDNQISVYISDGVEDALEILSYWQRIAPNMALDVQKYITGRNVDVEIWWNRGIPVGPPNYDIETKKFMPDDFGSSVGCATSVVWWSTRASKTWEVCKQLEPVMRRVDYTGPISLNLMIDEATHQIFLLEFTPRFGYNAYYCLWELDPYRFGEFMLMTFEAYEETLLPVNTHQFAAAARVSIPPYPFEHPDKKIHRQLYEQLRGMPISLEGDYPAKIYPGDVMLEDGKMVCAGIDGIIAEVVAVDESPEAAWAKVVETVKALKIPNKQARLADGIDDFQKWFPRFVAWKVVGDIDRLPRRSLEGIRMEEEDGEPHPILRAII